MASELLLPFLLIVALGTYVQTVTGFALGMIIMGAVTGLDLAPIAFTSAIVSLLSLANCSIALRTGHHHIDKKAVGIALMGLLPTMVIGVLLLEYLSTEASQWLQLLLGSAIVYSGIAIALKPEPLEQRSSTGSFLFSGILGGAFGGLFSIAGPPLVFQFYRQPISLAAIRNSLLCLFAVMNLSRTCFIGYQGKLSEEILILSLLSLPVVALVTAFGQRFPPPFSDNSMRRFAFSLLICIGLSLIGSVVLQLI